MKKVLNGLVLSAKVAGSIAGILFGAFVFVSVVGFVMHELGLESQRNKDIRVYAQADCKARGGQWVVNPHSYIPHAIYGEGCNIDYIRREQLRRERASK